MMLFIKLSVVCRICLKRNLINQVNHLKMKFMVGMGIEECYICFVFAWLRASANRK